MRDVLFGAMAGSLLAFMVAGCGSSSGGTCSNAAACGGNLVGTWTITSSCVSASVTGATSGSCPGATGNSSNLGVRGSVTYNADGTYSSNSTLGGTVNVYLPPSCLMSSGVTVTCDQLNQVFASNPTPGVTVTCSGSSGCTCVETITAQPSTETGTYATSAGVLTETPTGGTSSQTDYCVKGTTLTLSPHAGSAMMGQIESGTITLTKN